MTDPHRTNPELIEEICALKKRIRELSHSETPRRQEEEALRLAIHNEAVLAAVPDIIMEVDGCRRYTWANQAGLRFFGEDVIGREASCYIEGEQETCNKAHPLFDDLEDVVYVESWQRRQDGEKRLLAWSCKALKNEQGVVIGALSTGRDITERKRAEEKLHESEEKYRNILENIEEGYYETDLAGNFTFFSPSLCGILGYSKAEIAGMNYRACMDAENAKKVLQAFNEVSVTGIPTTFELEIIQKDGARTYNEDSVSLIAKPGETPTGFRGFVRNITERKRIEEELRDSEGRHRRIIEASSDAMLLHHKGMITFANPSALKLFRANQPADLIGKQFLDLVHPDDRALSIERIRKMFNENRIGSPREHRLLALDGQVLNVESTGVPVQYRGETHIFGIFRDISDRMRAKEALEKERNLLKNLIDNVPDRIYAKDSEGRFIICNEAMIRRMGKTSMAELAGKSDFELLPHEMAQRFHADEQAILQSGIPMINREEPLATEGGKITRWNLATKVPLLDKQGNRIGIVGVGREITDRKQAEDALRKSEERYRVLVEKASDIVFRTNDAGNFTFVNPATLLITGYEEKELIGNHFSTLIRLDMLDETMKFFNQQVTKGIQNTYLEYSIVTRDGHDVWLGQNTQLISEDGRVVGFQAVARDIMESKRKEAEILSLSITDPLTGLHNRRGFLSLARQQLKLSERNKSGLLLFFADLDGLKWVNDTLGHEEGDKALIEAAAVLKETFRASDIIARLGGDEYAALAVDITEVNSAIIAARLQSFLDTRNNQETRRYKLSISMGCSYYDPENPRSIDELMASADKLMYEQKQNKKGLLLQGDSFSSSA